MGRRLFKLFAPPAWVQQSPWSVNSQTLCTTKYKQKTQKTQTQWQIQKQLETPWQNNEYKNAEIQNSYAKVNWNISIAATLVNQKHRTMIKIRNHIAMALWSRLWRLGLQWRRGEPISLPQFLPLTPPPWQTELLGNKLGHIHDGQPGKLSQVGKLIKWQHTGSHTGKFGNQASTITGWQTLGNEMTLTDLLTSHIDEIYPQLQRYKTCLSLAFYIFQWQTI